MIRTAFKNRFHDKKAAGARRPERGGRRDGGAARGAPYARREPATVVHPWLSLPERLAAAQEAMRELAGQAAFSCPLREMYAPQRPTEAVALKPAKPAVSIIVRKRRIPISTSPSAATSS